MFGGSAASKLYLHEVTWSPVSVLTAVGYFVLIALIVAVLSAVVVFAVRHVTQHFQQQQQKQQQSSNVTTHASDRAAAHYRYFLAYLFFFELPTMNRRLS